MSLERYGPLVRRPLRFFLSAEDAPDERLLAFFQASVIPAEATCDDVWALATRFALADVRAGRRRNLLVAPPLRVRGRNRPTRPRATDGRASIGSGENRRRSWWSCWCMRMWTA